MPRADDCGHSGRLHRRRRGDSGLLRFAHRNRRYEIRLSHCAHAWVTACPSAISRGFLTLIGVARVKDMIFTARLIGADEALQIGLLTETVKNRVELDARAGALASTIAGHAPLTLRATKEGSETASIGRSSGSRPYFNVLHERGFPRGHGRIPGKAKSEVARALIELAIPPLNC